MAELTKQFLIKMSPEMNERIEQHYSNYLKKGNYITKSEYIRCLLNDALTDGNLSYDEICLLGKFARDLQRQNTYVIWSYPFKDWELIFQSLFDKELLIKSDKGAYMISEKGGEVWKSLPIDQKKRLIIPMPK
jgi:hypothetical protein